MVTDKELKFYFKKSKVLICRLSIVVTKMVRDNIVSPNVTDASII